MLKSVRDLFRSIKCLPQLKAIAQPSVVDVPRPSSSTHTMEFFVASRKGFAISDISTAKSRKSRTQIVSSTHANEDSVAGGEVEGFRWGGRAHVREDGGNADLSKVGRFPAHVSARKEEEVFVR